MKKVKLLKLMRMGGPDYLPEGAQLDLVDEINGLFICRIPGTPIMIDIDPYYSPIEIDGKKVEVGE